MLEVLWGRDLRAFLFFLAEHGACVGRVRLSSSSGFTGTCPPPGSTGGQGGTPDSLPWNSPPVPAQGLLPTSQDCFLKKMASALQIGPRNSKSPINKPTQTKNKKRVVCLLVCAKSPAEQADSGVFSYDPKPRTNIIHCQKIKMWDRGKGGKPANSFYEVSLILILGPGKSSTRKGKFESISLMNINENPKQN